MNTYDAVKKGIDYIEANLNNSIGVSDVADAVSYSQFYFSREFSRHAHISVYDYILRRKISEAYKYLFAADIKIIDLAVQFGFQSHEVFTRAFRKMFGENPSEAFLYKPFAVFEAIDEPYLSFLSGLRIAFPEEAARELFFEVDTRGESVRQLSSLTLLFKDNLFACKDVYMGTLADKEGGSLSFVLHNMTRKIRIYHTDVKRALRYFLDNTYDAGELCSNYILMNREEDYIDVYIPNKGG